MSLFLRAGDQSDFLALREGECRGEGGAEFTNGSPRSVEYLRRGEEMRAIESLGAHTIAPLEDVPPL